MMTDQDCGPHEMRAVEQRLESLRRAGVTDLRRATTPSAATQPAPRSEIDDADTTARPVAAPTPAGPSDDAPRQRTLSPSTPAASMPKQSLEARCAALDALRRRVAGCTRCAELVQNRTQTVFGVGNPRPRLVFLGEAPGADEDRQGEPFVGRAGKLLNDIITACTFRREDVYILNILKCRPPGNRNPLPQEADNCEEYLQEQLEILQPEYICCLGAVAATNLLNTNSPIGRLRGKFHDYHGIKVVATYHPAYLLRNPSAKRHTWDDMKMLLGDMGVEIPSNPKK
jgi:DNA polymerase